MSIVKAKHPRLKYLYTPHLNSNITGHMLRFKEAEKISKIMNISQFCLTTIFAHSNLSRKICSEVETSILKEGERKHEILKISPLACKFLIYVFLNCAI